MKLMPQTITFAITGASGMPYAICLLRELLACGIQVKLLISKAGLLTIHQELNVAVSGSPAVMRTKLIAEFGLANPEKLQVYALNDWFAPMASGSSVDDAMVVCPCSMATLAKIANGLGDDLITRSADVILKERRNLLVVPREMPLSAIHLENMLKLARLGAAIIPPIPAFYTHPQSLEDIINFIVSRILDQLGIANTLAKRW
jgi:4-hydroxy-3-polyprenylbenzoate decarboxylase